MPQTSTVPTTFGDSLRAIAELFDRVPSMILAVENPSVPLRVGVCVRTKAAVEGIAALLDSEVESYAPTPTDDVHTFTTIQCGRAQLHVFHIDDDFGRELHRALSVQPPHERLEP